jgi:hypothetical protein
VILFDRAQKLGTAASLERRDWLLIGSCWLALAAFYLVFAHVRDVDDTVRLIQVRALLGGQDWFDLSLRRIAPPGGVEMHWSRLVDLPVAGAVLLARLFVDPAQAERFALVAVPLLTMGCAAALLYRATMRLVGSRGAAIVAALLGCTAAALFGQLNPGRIDHHGWQIVAALAALNGLLADRPATRGAVIGSATAVWLAISIEGLPMTAAFLAVLGLRWIDNREERSGLVSAAAALASVSIALWLATHRIDPAALAPWCDVVTPVHLAMFAWTALGTGVVALLPLGGRLRDFVLLGAVALGALAIFALAAPQCLGGGYESVDPLVQRYWLANVGEAMALWTRPWVLFVAGAMPAFLGLAVLAAAAWRARPQVTPMLWTYLIVLAAATTLGCLIIRSLGAAVALAMPPLAWALLAGLRRTAAEPRVGVRVAGWLVLLAAISPWMVQIGLLISIRAEEKEKACDLAGHAAALHALPPATFLAPFDLGPQLLPTTRHAILASGHHRAREAMRDQLTALLGTSAEAREVIDRREIGYVTVCFETPEVQQYREAAPDGFLSRLARGEVPAWLIEVPIAGEDAPKVWQVNLSAAPRPATRPAAPGRQGPSP